MYLCLHKVICESKWLSLSQREKPEDFPTCPKHLRQSQLPGFLWPASGKEFKSCNTDAKLTVQLLLMWVIHFQCTSVAANWYGMGNQKRSNHTEKPVLVTTFNLHNNCRVLWFSVTDYSNGTYYGGRKTIQGGKSTLKYLHWKKANYSHPITPGKPCSTKASTTFLERENNN